MSNVKLPDKLTALRKSFEDQHAREMDETTRRVEDRNSCNNDPTVFAAKFGSKSSPGYSPMLISISILNFARAIKSFHS